MVIIGIVGGIGAGKSFTTQEFVTQGAAYFNADTEAKKFYSNPEICTILQSRWKRFNVFDSASKLNYQLLANILFDKTEIAQQERKYLDSLLQPYLWKEFLKFRDSAQIDGYEILVLDAPLLFEVGWEKNVDFIVFVEASVKTRLRRIQARGWTEQELRRREALQLSIEEKRKKADFIVDANDDDSQMNKQVTQIIDSIRHGSLRQMTGII